jgi:hypothetical protein
LRHSCFLNHKACAEFLGVSVRTVRYWDAGRSRVPWSVVKLLRLYRLGDLGVLHGAWSGWILNRNGLWSPDGKRHDPGMMTAWWLTCEQARWWRQDYDQRAARGVGAPAPARPQAVTLQPEAVEAVSLASAVLLVPIEVAIPANLPALPACTASAERSEAESVHAGVWGGAPRNLTLIKTKQGRFLETALWRGLSAIDMGPKWGHDGATIGQGLDHENRGIEVER